VTEQTKPSIYLCEPGLILSIPMGQAKINHTRKVLGLYPPLTLTILTISKGVLNHTFYGLKPLPVIQPTASKDWRYWHCSTFVL